jgi:hypothetical protein
MNIYRCTFQTSTATFPQPNLRPEKLDMLHSAQKIHLVNINHSYFGILKKGDHRCIHTGLLHHSMEAELVEERGIRVA